MGIILPDEGMISMDIEVWKKVENIGWDITF